MSEKETRKPVVLRTSEYEKESVAKGNVKITLKTSSYNKDSKD